jgi:hypothetical protein
VAYVDQPGLSERSLGGSLRARVAGLLPTFMLRSSVGGGRPNLIVPLRINQQLLAALA